MKNGLMYFMILLLCIPIVCIGQRFTLKELGFDSSKNKFGKVLIAGVGTVETRHFLETLSEKIISTFKANKIESEFRFLGKDSTLAKKELGTLPQNYDALLLFNPIDSARLLVFGGNIGGGEYNLKIRTRDITYSQSFFLTLSSVSNPQKIIWKSSLYVSTSPTYWPVYTNITRKNFSLLNPHLIFQ